MFRRRFPRPRVRLLRELVWPSAGWHRSSRYLAHRVRRLPDTPYRIAAGFACGAAISITPFLGFHFVLSALLAWSLRANILASAFGTVVGNPWTFPLIFWWTYELGNAMMGEFGGRGELPEELTVSFLLHHPWRVLLPMFLGSVPTAIVVWVLSFWLVRMTVSGYRRARQHRLERIRARLGAEGADRRG
jgi:uncharacterized protein (DUF2062 family)